VIPRRFLAGAWEHLRASDSARVRALKLVVVPAYLIAFSLTPRLWISARTYPTVPVWEGLPPVPWPVDVLWFAALAVLLVLSLIEGQRRLCIGSFLVLSAPLMLWDQSRWQVPIYQYLLLLATVSAYPVTRDDAASTRSLQTARIIIVATYFWSGVQKMNATFLRRIFPWMIGPVVAGWPDGIRSVVSSAGVLVPPLEVAIALGLLSQRYRRAAVFVALAMHVAIVLLLGPLGHKWDRFVWPWNVAMAAFVVILFAGTTDQSFSALRAACRPGYGMLVLVLVGLMPAFSFVNLWDTYLSWTAYSGNVAEAALRFSDAAVGRLPERVRGFVKRHQNGENSLDVIMWSFHDLGVESYPEVRVYRHVAKWVCQQTSDPTGIKLIIWERPAILDDRRRTTTYTCGEV
jgi:hypothetical protein